MESEFEFRDETARCLQCGSDDLTLVETGRMFWTFRLELQPDGRKLIMLNGMYDTDLTEATQIACNECGAEWEEGEYDLLVNEQD